MNTRDRWHYVYRLQSIPDPSFGYTGVASNLHRRLAQHNRRENPSTAPHAPLQLVFAAAFPDKKRAHGFENYLKTGSGCAFSRKRLWP
jgi:predicted GIY-YIG superfamily endonuclease